MYDKKHFLLDIVITYKKVMKFSTNIIKLLHYVHLLYSKVLS